MKKNMIILSSLFLSLSAFAYNGSKLCYQEGRNHLRSYYSQTGLNERLVTAQMADYYDGKSLEGGEIVQYAYDTQTTKGYRYTRITMAKKTCQLLVASSNVSKDDMEADDLEAAQGGF